MSACTLLCFAVIDDENPTVYTAGAIVTVTVSLVRQNMSVLFGDDTVTDKHEQHDVSAFMKGDEEEDDKRDLLVNVATFL
jgi:translocation protein SEC63